MHAITVEERETHVLVVVSGRLDSRSSLELQQVLSDLVNAGNINLVLDLQGVEFLSSSGLAAIVGNLKTIRDVQGQLWLAAASPAVESVLQLTGLDRLFPIFPDDKL